mgnify:CR=1 FL=1
MHPQPIVSAQNIFPFPPITMLGSKAQKVAALAKKILYFAREISERNIFCTNLRPVGSPKFLLQPNIVIGGKGNILWPMTIRNLLEKKWKGNSFYLKIYVGFCSSQKKICRGKKKSRKTARKIEKHYVGTARKNPLHRKLGPPALALSRQCRKKCEFLFRSTREEKCEAF